MSVPEAMSASLPFVSVIIPAWNCRDQVAGCLQALAAQTYPRDRFEVLLIDNGSTDGTAEVARAFGVTALSEPTPGSYHARNRGLAEARGELIAFTDADCEPAPDWLANAVSAAQAHPHAGVLAGKIELRPSGPAIYCTFERLFAFRQDHDAKRGLCATANWMSRREHLQRLGGFEASRKSGADGELARKFHEAGLPVVYVDDMVVRHPARGALRDLAQRRRRLTGGRWERTHGAARSVKVLGIIVWDTARRLKTAAVAPGLRAGERVQVAGLVLAMSGVAMAELTRLMAGGASHRA